MAAETPPAFLISGCLSRLRGGAFLRILGVSAIALIALCQWTRSEPDEVLEAFYRNARPWVSGAPRWRYAGGAPSSLAVNNASA